MGLRFVLQSHPDNFGLICLSCSSGRVFAASFLQIPPRDGHPCPWLTLSTAKRVRIYILELSSMPGTPCPSFVYDGVLFLRDIFNLFFFNRKWYTFERKEWNPFQLKSQHCMLI